MHKTLAGAAGLLAATSLTLGLAGPAGAASIGVPDPADISHGVDLRSVEVRNNDKNLVVITTHTNLRRDPSTGSGGAVYLDTDPEDKGPEYVFVGGYYAGTDYQLFHTEGFGHWMWGRPAVGASSMTVDYAKEHVRMQMSRKSVGHPGKVRVAVRASGTRSDGTMAGLVDWIGEPRSFTRWVAKG